jgi:saccharopine dehydrogenase (NAD+, L-lysine-forming)
MGGSWLIYGANGYTGRLIVEEAVRRGARPVLAGRRAEALETLARAHGLETRVFGLDAIGRGLDGMNAVLHCAGPFSATSRPMLDACLAAGASYLDITGEIEVFEACYARDHEARARGVVVLPGVGFDVVPTDCVAARLAAELPGATRLELALASDGGVSGGTAKTAIEGLPRGGMVREGGVLRRVPTAWKRVEIPFRDRARSTMTIPWGDVSSAFRSTKIPDITVYAAVDARAARALALARPLLGVFAFDAVRRLAQAAVGGRLLGPSADVRATARVHLWGRATDAAGRSVSATLETREVYALTARTAVEAVLRVCAGGVAPGALTPSLAFGAGFIEELEGEKIALAAA